MAPSAKIDKKSCLSSGRCIEMESEAFGWDDDDLGEVKAEAAKLSPERLLEVARNCPGLAIAVLDEAGEEVEL